MSNSPTTYNLQPTTKGSVSIFILIDALGWEYIKDRPFLSDIAVTKQPVKSILGFSSAVIPSILTGKLPQEHKHWSLYFNSPRTSPFWWTQFMSWMPKKILNSRLSRKIVEEISKRGMGYSGYFETYIIPIELLHIFDISEEKNIYAPRGIREGKSIFDILQEEKVNCKVFTYPLKDKEILKSAINELETSQSRFYFLYCSEFDAFLHYSCKNKEAIRKKIDYYEKSIREVYETAKHNFEDVKLYVFSDHGMARIDKSYDLKSDVEKLGFSAPKDYIPFYDSTMARFWFSNPEAREKITALLKSKPYGRILSNDELNRYGAEFTDWRYGEIIFLMETGAVINPSFMGSKPPAGMHGFDPDHCDMNAILISNKKVSERLDDVRGFFDIMVSRVKESKPKTKILYFLNSFVRGGAEEHALRLIEGIDKKRFEPILVLPQQLLNTMEADLKKAGIRYYPATIRRWYQIREIKKFFNILKKEKPDIVHSHLFLATMYAAPIAKLSGVPVVIETAHIREAWREGVKKAYFIDRFFYRFVDEIIAVSNAVKQYLVTDKRIRPKKITVIHNGVDIEKFSPLSTVHGPQNGNGKFHVGVIGRLEPQKGHKYFLEAVSMLNGKFDGLKFTIAGDGRLREDLEDKCRKLKIDDKVEFLSARKDIVSLFNELDLMVLPSLYEGLPLVALEASAMAKPVVVTDVDGSPEVIQHNQTGLVIPSKDPRALSDAMIFFYENRDIAAKYGENGRAHVSRYFDIKNQVTKTEEMYKSLVKG